VIEWTHRLLASILVVTVVSFAALAGRARREPGVGGRGGVLRATVWAVLAVFAAAILGAVTVKLGNTPYATAAHWVVAMALFATLAAAAVRAGALGGTPARAQGVSGRVKRAANAAAALAFFTVALGGLTAKLPDAAIACRGFPLCGRDPLANTQAVHVQSTHRVLAFLLLLHLIGVVAGLARRREESRTVAHAAYVALGLVLLQLTVAASMVLLRLPPVLRSLHEAVGVSVWLGTFTYAYLARVAAREASVRGASASPSPAATLGGTRADVVAVPGPSR
jgi:heme A synthase